MIDDELKALLQAMEARITEQIRDSQTEVIRVMMSFQENNALRLTDCERSDGALRERLGAMDRRMVEIERKLFGDTK